MARKEPLGEQVVMDVAHLRARGLSVPEIAATLDIGTSTVDLIIAGTWRSKTMERKQRRVLPTNDDRYDGRAYENKDTFTQVGAAAKSVVQAWRNRAGV